MSEEFKRRTQSRLGEGAALKEEILRAAARMLTQTGREGDLTLRAVAREVGISAPSIYLHFKSRADLVAALTHRAYRRLGEDLCSARGGAAGEGPRAALRAMARRYCCFALDSPRVYQLMFGIERVEVPWDEADPRPMREVHEVWLEAVALLGREGAALSDEQVARLLWASLHGIVSMAMALPFPTDRQTLLNMADDLLDLVLTGE